MPLLVNSVPNLAQGVSQQPDNLRYPGQCDEQINAWATVVEGLVKRPPTTYTKKIGATDPGAGLFTHFVKRDETNKYCVTVSLGNSVSIGQVGVIDLETGNNVSVSVTSIATSYLSGITNPLADLRALTVADYTFLVNNKKTVAKDANAYSSIPDREALIVVKLGDYSKYYSVYIDDTLVPWSTLHGSEHNPSGFPATYKSGASGDANADTEHIASDLAQLISAQYSTARTGITGISFTSGTGNSGWLQGNLKVLKTVRIPNIGGGVFGGGGNGTAEIPVDANAVPKRLEFVVKQGTNTSAKGFCEVLNGAITDFVFTHNGNNYNTDTVTNPLSVILSQTAFIEGAWKPMYGNSPVPPDTLTPTPPTTGNIAPFIVEVEGSIIRIRKTINVSNGGTNYLLKQEHISTADNEPGSGQAWEDFWEETTSTAGVAAWSIGVEYTKGEDFSVRTTDGLSNEALGAVYKEVSSITDLPKQCFNNFVVKVIGDADIDQDDYYVRFSTKDKERFGDGTWVETVGWEQDENKTGVLGGIQTKLDATTMPVTLVPVFTGNDITSFKLQTAEEDAIAIPPNEIGWRTRQAGNDETNPFPSFVGNKINEVFFFKNRLGFLTDSNVIFSEADEYFNFFRTTTQQLLDSAPIDVGLSHTKVAVLQHAVPFQEKLMLFSKQSQFVLRGADVLSPKTVAISPVTEYDISDSVQPIALGNYIYFTFRRNDFEGMYEYFVDNNTETFHSEEITSQIPKYITKQVEKIAGSQAENTIVVGTSGDRNTLFVYKYFWSNKEKIQSAWMKFTFGREVRGFDFIDSNLHLFTKDDDGLHLEKLTLEDGIKDAGLDYTLYLDSKVDGSELTTSYDAPSKTTTISGFEYDPADVVIYTKTGNKVTFTKTTSTAGTVGGDLTSIDFVAGIPYNMLYRFSDQTLKQPTERGGRSASDYAFQTIRNGSINYAETGHFTVEVTPKFRDKYTYAFNPDIVGANLTLNAFTPQDGHFRFPVQCQPNEAKIEVVSDSALPVKLLAAEFESMMIPRSRRYGA